MNFQIGNKTSRQTMQSFGRNENWHVKVSSEYKRYPILKIRTKKRHVRKSKTRMNRKLLCSTCNIVQR